MSESQNRNLHNIRQGLRSERASLSASKQQEHAKYLVTQSAELSWLATINSLVSYAPFNGEISPSMLVESINPEHVFLPRIVDYQRNLMTFLPGSSNCQTNRFGIDEPERVGDEKVITDIASFDLILLPMVGFDRQGNRLGMGGGYYDRALAAIKDQSHKPILLGLAHSFQEVTKIQTRNWDVSVDAILTEKEYIAINPNLEI